MFVFAKISNNRDGVGTKKKIENKTWPKKDDVKFEEKNERHHSWEIIVLCGKVWKVSIKKTNKICKKLDTDHYDIFQFNISVT